MEDGSVPAKAIETHPQWVNDGWIQGKFHLPTPIHSGDKFVAKIGFLKGASAGNVKFMVTAGTDGGDKVCEKVKVYDNTIVDFSCTFGNVFEGATFVALRVLANGVSAQDWAVWIEPRIERP